MDTTAGSGVSDTLPRLGCGLLEDEGEELGGIDGVVGAVVDPALAEDAVLHRADEGVSAAVERCAAIGERHLVDTGSAPPSSATSSVSMPTAPAGSSSRHDQSLRSVGNRPFAAYQRWRAIHGRHQLELGRGERGVVDLSHAAHAPGSRPSPRLEPEEVAGTEGQGDGAVVGDLRETPGRRRGPRGGRRGTRRAAAIVEACGRAAEVVDAQHRLGVAGTLVVPRDAQEGQHGLVVRRAHLEVAEPEDRVALADLEHRRAPSAAARSWSASWASTLTLL